MVLLAVVALLLLAMAFPMRQVFAQRARLADLQTKTDVLANKNEELREETERLRDPAYIERIARERYGMVRKGEIPFVIVPEGEATDPSKPS